MKPRALHRLAGKLHLGAQFLRRGSQLRHMTGILGHWAIVWVSIGHARRERGRQPSNSCPQAPPCPNNMNTFGPFGRYHCGIHIDFKPALLGTWAVPHRRDCGIGQVRQAREHQTRSTKVLAAPASKPHLPQFRLISNRCLDSSQGGLACTI